MRFIYLLVMLLVVSEVSAQKGKKYGLVSRMQRFHQMMVNKPLDFVMDLYVHDSLSYGHSNGWIENRKEFRENLANKYIVYHSFREDSINVVEEGRTAYIRFIADIDATLNGSRAKYHLKVLEVWVKKDKTWQLFARQAVKG